MLKLSEDEINEIENKIACNEMNAAQVFTQMRQHIINRNDVIDEAIATIKSCELVEPNVYRIRLDEAIGALYELKLNINGIK